jgi:hypothetical protein
MPPELLSLSWQIQVTLASGYAAYIIAFTGIRDHHRALDTTFGALVFGLIASAVLALSTAYLGPIFAGALALTSACAVGLLWRRWGRKALIGALRKMKVTQSDSAPSSWATLTSDTQHYVSQIAVLLDDGTWLRCDDTTPFADAPFGPCCLGPNGDLALYLTHTESSDGAVTVLTTVRDDYYGDRVTYVPAARIRQVTMRHILASRLRTAEEGA